MLVTTFGAASAINASMMPQLRMSFKFLVSPISWIRVSRNLFSKSGTWVKQYDESAMREVEEYWQPRLRSIDEKSCVNDKEDAERYYVLSMFPYPSGNLHMGHVRVYTIADAVARYQRLRGRYVFQPMGWDAFGLPAENAAFERGENPQDWTYSNISRMRGQLDALSLSLDWGAEFATCDPAYYRWTQWLFLLLHRHGLVYRQEAAVNWDPVDGTVVANEQIDGEGRAWRSRAKVERRMLPQWYIRTTRYSQALYEGLSGLEGDLWSEVVALQRTWIGECSGMRMRLNLLRGERPLQDDLAVWTRHPHAVYGASHILLSPLHPLNKQQQDTPSADTPYTPTPLTAVHPLTQQRLPVYVAHAHDFGDFLDHHLAIPSCCDGDRMFAAAHVLPYRSVISESDAGDLRVKDSDEMTGMAATEAAKAISRRLENLSHGGERTSERARDWGISRQRYWGTPIPIVHCTACGAVPVPAHQLPVVLPRCAVTTRSGDVVSPLEAARDWVSTACPACGAHARRETDTMDTFVDSSWYFLRYLDPHNGQLPFSRAAADRYMPVDLYVGGKEHAIMHLYYARFFAYFLHDHNMLGAREPFTQLMTQGMVLGESHSHHGRYVPPNEVDFCGPARVEKATGAALLTKWEKMSKSKYNGVDPLDELAVHGVDAVRLCILASVSPRSERRWNDTGEMLGVSRLQRQVWNVVTWYRHLRSTPDPPSESSSPLQPSDSSETHPTRGSKCVTPAASAPLQPPESSETPPIPNSPHSHYERIVRDARNEAVLKVTRALECWMFYQVHIEVRTLTRELTKIPAEHARISPEFERALADLVVMLSPLAPLMTSELWAGLASLPRGSKWVAAGATHLEPWGDVREQRWPVVDSDHRLRLRVMVDERPLDIRDRVYVPCQLGEEETLKKDEAIALLADTPEYQSIAVSVVSHDLQITPAASVTISLKTSKGKKKKKRN